MGLLSDRKLPGSVKGIGTIAPPKCENVIEIAIFRRFTQYTDADEILPVSVDNWSTVACQIWT